MMKFLSVLIYLAVLSSSNLGSALAFPDHEKHARFDTSRTLQYIEEDATSEFTNFNVNCGSSTEIVDADGSVWLPDANFTGGFFLGRPVISVESLPDIPAQVFQTMRQSMEFSSSFTYEFKVPNGDYTVVFLFAELVYDTVDERVFVIKMENVVKFAEVDILKLAGGQFKGVKLSRRVFVVDGKLTIDFISLKGGAAVSGLRIVKTNNPGDQVSSPAASATLVPTLAPTAPVLVAPPHTEQPTPQPTDETDQPVVPQPTAQPMASQPTKRPITPQPTAQPMASQPTKRPITPQPTKQPVAPVASPPDAVSPTPTDPDFEPILINAGGEAYIDLYGRKWEEDNYFRGGNTFVRNNSISETEDDVIYTSERYGDFKYIFHVPVATYEVVLHFAETIMTEEGSRIFSIKIQNETVYDNIDLFVLAERQPLKAFTLESTEIVSDDFLLIEFVNGGKSVPKINGIEINYLEPHLAHAVAQGPYSGVAGENGKALIQLDGSPSHTHGVGLRLVEWAWKVDGVVVSTEESAAVEFSVGDHVATLFVKDYGQNEDADSTTVQVFPDGFPDVLSLSPNKGLVDGNDTVTITGSGFNYYAGETTVYFGERVMTGQNIKIIDGNTIRVQAPKAAIATPVPVSVKTPLGTSNKVLYTYLNGVPIEFSSSRITSIDSPTTVAFGADGKLYVGTSDGVLYKITVDDDFNVIQTVESHIVFGRMILGLTFDPMDISANPAVYISHSQTFHGEAFSTSGKSINGKVSRISGANLDSIEHVVTGLPVSDHDHAVNGLEFGDNGELYIQVAGNTNSGVAGRLSTTRKLKDSALSSATLVAYMSRPGFDGNITYDAPDDGNVISGSGVEIFAYGFRNPYDIVLHSNGKLYGTDNGPNVKYGDRLMGCKSGETLPDIQEDDTINWIRKGHYYGMPNLKRGLTDSRQCTWRSNHEPSDTEYTAPLAIVPASFDGIVEFQTNHFNGQLRGNLIVAKYKKELYRVILNDDGTEVIPESKPPIAISGEGTLDVTQAPDGSLVDARYLAGAVHYYRPVEPETSKMIVKGVFPRRGSQAGGSQLTVYGVNFVKYGSVAVTIGGMSCPVSKVSAKKIVCTLPGGSGTVDVVVSAGSEASRFERGYRYITGQP